jgi:hypothetical protein
MYKTFYGVLAEAARWLVSQGVTHVAMEATGICSILSSAPDHRFLSRLAGRWLVAREKAAAT